MGLIGNIKKVVIDVFLEVTSQTHIGFDQISRLINSPGIDSNPINGDNCCLFEVGSAGHTVTVGVFPSSLEAEQGEIRVHSRDENGDTKAFVHLYKDGKILLESATATLELNDNFVVTSGDKSAVRYAELKTAFDELKSDFNSFVTTVYNLHMHPTAAVGPASPPTLTGSSSAADMSGSESATVLIP